MNIIIIGAGAIGSAVASQMITAGHAVTVVARNRRLAQIQQHGLQFYKQNLSPLKSPQLSQIKVTAVAALMPDMVADVILVTVQRHHMQALIPALMAHPCACVVFMCNFGGDLNAVAAPFNDRLFWAFPSMLAGLNPESGLSHHFILPRWLSFLQITTIGSALTPINPALRERTQKLVALFNEADIASIGCNSMANWLKSHAALMLPLIASGTRNIARHKPLKLDWQDCGLAAAAMKESFLVLSKAAITIEPLNIRLLAQWVPVGVIQVFLYILFRSNIAENALRGHADHAAGEVAQLYVDMQQLAQAVSMPIPALTALCS